ncbi:DUF2637 domain-containing protein [Streptosporangiaceae bacterium NEAU-GS5]|nr:DUF2637 domain-containing protein [Streptosporangiaceae bacterium NEAU-GS5]
MVATPPAAAYRPSSPTPPAAPSAFVLGLRRIGIGLAGLAVAVLTAAACVLSFDDLRSLALIGRAQEKYAYLYPVAFDALLVVALLGLLLLRTGRLLVRIQVGAVLVLLLVAAATAAAATASGTGIDPSRAAVVVALLPWVMLTVGLWLLLLIITYAHARRADLDDADDAAEELVPFDSTQPLPVPSSVRPADVRPADVRPADVRPAEPQAESGAPASPGKHSRPSRPGRPARPVRWGDLQRYRPGDVLVHPLPKRSPGESGFQPDEPPTPPAVPELVSGPPPETDSDDESGVDTQPMRQISDAPDPAHGPESADPEELAAPDAPATTAATATAAATTAAPAAIAPATAPPKARAKARARPKPKAEEGPVADEGPAAEAAGDTAAAAAAADEAEPKEASTDDVGTDDVGTVPMAPPSGRVRSTPRRPTE